MSLHNIEKDEFLSELKKLDSQNISLCYQCGKCSAGCSLREFAEESPNKIIRYIQLGMYDKALQSKMIWLCAACHTCGERCPQKFDLAKLMDALRILAVKRGVKLDKDVLKFHKAFMNQIYHTGRAYELGMTVEYKMKSGDYFQDMDVAPKMIFNGKVSIFPHLIKGRKKVQQIIKKLRNEK